MGSSQCLRKGFIMKVGDRVWAHHAIDPEIKDQIGVVTSLVSAGFGDVKVTFDKGSIPVPVHVDELVVVNSWFIEGQTCNCGKFVAEKGRRNGSWYDYDKEPGFCHYYPGATGSTANRVCEIPYAPTCPCQRRLGLEGLCAVCAN